MIKKLWLSAAFLPLVIAPAAIVASCSNDTTTPANQTEAKKEATRLNEVIKSNKLKIKDGTTFTETMLNELNTTPDNLFNYLDEKELVLDKTKFDYNIDSLTGIDVKPKQDAPAAPAPEARTMSFKFKVTNKANTGESDFTEVASVAYQYQAPAQPPVEPTPLEKAVKAIEDAHANGTFKLKADKAEIAQTEIDNLKANPANFLTQYTDGFPQPDSNTFEAKVVAANFVVEAKQSNRAGTPSVIKFKVTVSEKASKKEQLTKELTFDFSLTADPTPPNPDPGAGGGNF